MATTVPAAPTATTFAGLTAEAATMRDELTRWLDDHRRELEPFVAQHAQDIESQVARERDLVAALDEAGWTRRGWPIEAGGSGGTAVSRAVLYDVLPRVGLAVPETFVLLETLGPVLTRYAKHLARRHLGDILAGRTIWAQGFSEPGAGSDLASLACRATASAAGFRLRGQKTWTTLGHLADFALVLARTGEAGHRGLSAIWVDLHAPGVTVRPITASNGRNEFAEMFFDDVEVRSDHLIGTLGQGWEIAMYLLQYERGMYAWLRQGLLHHHLEECLASVAPHDDEAQRAVGQAFVLLSALRQRSWSTVRQLAADVPLGPEISVDKILLSRSEQAVHDATRIAAPASFLFDDSAAAQNARADWFYSRASSIFGGAVDVQRNIVADRVLRLPKVVR